MGLAFLITSDHLQLLSQRKVLKQAEYSAMLEAADLVEAARREAQRIETQAKTRAHEEREKARVQGREQARIEHAAQCIDSATRQRRQLAALRESMARLVVKGVTQFIAQADAAQIYESALARVDALVRDEPFIEVRVAPDSEAPLRRALETLRHAHGPLAAATVRVDAALASGACVLHTPGGSIELGVPAQIEAFERALRQSPGALP